MFTIQLVAISVQIPIVQTFIHSQIIPSSASLLIARDTQTFVWHWVSLSAVCMLMFERFTSVFRVSELVDLFKAEHFWDVNERERGIKSFRFAIHTQPLWVKENLLKDPFSSSSTETSPWFKLIQWTEEAKLCEAEKILLTKCKRNKESFLQPPIKEEWIQTRKFRLALCDDVVVIGEFIVHSIVLQQETFQQKP